MNKLQASEKLFAYGRDHLLKYFANGTDIIPALIKPRLELVASKTKQAALFRFATLTWSIPVSSGYGRRLRFLIWDDQNGKLIGIIGLTDPVFNLKVRDELIGWNAARRKDALVHIMDAFAVGAVPPYSGLLGGKLIAALLRTQEIRDAFRSKYVDTTGIISGSRKRASLVSITTSSALGRSSVYNRLSLNGFKYLSPIGYTSGWGHFHLPNGLFATLREYLKTNGHHYSGNNRFGDGPNWRLRAIRQALLLLGLHPNLLRHGIKRQVFRCDLADNADAFLRGDADTALYTNLAMAAEVGQLAVDRWMLPRALTRPEFCDWKKDRLLNQITEQSESQCVAEAVAV